MGEVSEGARLEMRCIPRTSFPVGSWGLSGDQARSHQPLRELPVQWGNGRGTIRDARGGARARDGGVAELSPGAGIGEQGGVSPGLHGFPQAGLTAGSTAGRIHIK